MTKRILVVAGALACFALLATGAFAQDYTCSSFTGNLVEFMGAGSSAQFNTFAYAAIDYGNALATQHSLTGVAPEIWSAKNGKGSTVSTLYFQDTRFGTPNGTSTTASPQDAVNMWVVWMPADTTASSDCYLWVDYNIDSGVGVKDFFAYNKNLAAGGVPAFTGASNYPVCLSGSAGCPGTAFHATVYGSGQSIVPGLADQATLPTALQNFIAKLYSPTSSAGPKPLPYCGQPSTVTVAAAHYCYLNAGLTDIRPEDALYATQRALSSYNTTNGLGGLGYNNVTCGASGTNQGCPIYTSEATGTVFNVLRFALSGTDPVTKASEPTYSTLSTGAAPVVVFVQNKDTGTLAFGSLATGGVANRGPYNLTNVNRKNLAFVYEGTSGCTGDLFPTASGPGKPIQVFQREPLSGTYNTFEFNAVRTLYGSAALAVGENKISSTSWITDDDSGQELNTFPANAWGGAGCPNSASTAPTATCGDPLYQQTVSCNGAGPGVKYRAIGTGELVKAVINGNGAAAPTTNDAIGYAFWSYQNFQPVASGCTQVSNGNATCTTYTAHYLTVDGIDPFFNAPGGDPTPGATAFNPPQCGFVSASGTFPCFQLPFTHIADGSYPIWSLLRLATFGNAPNATPSYPCTSPQTYCTPVGVLNTVAYAEDEAVNDTYNLSEFYPFLNTVTHTGTLENPTWKGNLNLGVFRSHYKQATPPVNPDNGHYQNVSGTFSTCPTTNLALVGATKTTPTCWVDFGGDMGGVVLTVQSDLDFINDFGLNGTVLNPPNPAEIYGLHQ